MKPEKLTDLVAQLTSEEQSAVREFIEFIRRRKDKVHSSPFLSAIEEFIAEHPELLRRLAQ